MCAVSDAQFFILGWMFRLASLGLSSGCVQRSKRAHYTYSITKLNTLDFWYLFTFYVLPYTVICCYACLQIIVLETHSKATKNKHRKFKAMPKTAECLCLRLQVLMLSVHNESICCLQHTWELSSSTTQQFSLFPQQFRSHSPSTSHSLFYQKLSDGAVKVVTVGSCYINWVCCCDGFVKHNWVWPIAMDSSISC
jgi:hypothetical protein